MDQETLLPEKKLLTKTLSENPPGAKPVRPVSKIGQAGFA
jgi:hypothetical protein